MVTWRTTTIDDACNVEYGTRVVQKRDGGSIYPVYGGGGATFFMDTTNRANRVVVSRFGMSEECTRFVDGEFFLNDSGLTLSPKDTGTLLQTFLDRLTLALNDEIFALGKGSAQKKLDAPAFRGLRIAYPASLAEQRRIVAILDEAFEGIATAKANTETTLRNVRELPRVAMRRALTTGNTSWTESTIGDQVTLQRGFDITKDQQRDGQVPVVSSGGIRSHHDTSMVRAPGVVMGRKGTLGKVFYLEEDFWPHDTTLWVKDFKGNDPRFVHRFFEVLDVQGLDSGAANPALNRNQVHPLRVVWPPLGEQIALAERMENLSAGAVELASIYMAKISALDELKRSLLHQAFTGALTSKSTDKQVAEVA